jgi:hypothetical protein
LEPKIWEVFSANVIVNVLAHDLENLTTDIAYGRIINLGNKM